MNKATCTLIREDDTDSEIEDDNTACVVCGTFQPDNLNLNQSINFVNWAQCDLCRGWVLLKFCTTVEACGDETFYYDKCLM